MTHRILTASFLLVTFLFACPSFAAAKPKERVALRLAYESPEASVLSLDALPPLTMKFADGLSWGLGARIFDVREGMTMNQRVVVDVGLRVAAVLVMAYLVSAGGEGGAGGGV